MKTYKEFKEAAALAIPAAMKLAPYVIPALGGIVKGVSAITNRETGLSDSEKKRLADLMDRVKANKEREETQRTEKEILIYGRKRGIAERPKKRVDEGMLPKTEKGINNAMKKGLDKLDQKYQKEYDDRKYPLDKKA